MTAILVLSILLAFLVALGLLEFLAHRANLASLKLRIHVNGTRGKSSVTRLATAALNEAGIRTFGKTTGTLPRMIFPDGREYPIFRPAGLPNVLEQLRVVAVARENAAEALVLECMAIQPRLQWLCERKLVHATHAVVTNAREDHLDVMGPTERDVALALAATVARNHHFFTCEVRNLDVFRTACQDRNSELHAVSPEMVAAVTREDMKGFSYQEHEENVALVLELCRSLGICREAAMRGMWKARPDEGALTTYELDFFGRRIFFVNAFAANDPESTARLWHMALDAHPDVQKRIAVFNCRIDRQHRSLQLAQAYPRWRPADMVLLMGSGTFVFAREASHLGVDPSVFVHAEGFDAKALFEKIVHLGGKSSVVVGMANIAGAGLDLVHYFGNRSIIKE